VVGPLTLRQFLFLAAGAGLIFFFFFVLKLAFAIMLSIPVGAAAMALAFLKVQGMPLWKYLSALLSFTRRPQQYYWKK
jgi:hypothetical protein